MKKKAIKDLAPLRRTLRAGTINDTPSLSLIEKRVDFMIEFFETVHAERIFLATSAQLLVSF